MMVGTLNPRLVCDETSEGRLSAAESSRCGRIYDTTTLPRLSHSRHRSLGSRSRTAV